MWPCGQTCQECWELEPSAGARIPPLWASLDWKPPEGASHVTGRPIAVAVLRRTSEANLLAVAIELLDVVDGATPDEGLGKEHHLAIQPLLIILSWSFLTILFMLKSASPLQWNAMHQMQLNAVECNLWITNYSTSFCVFRLLQSRFHSGRTLAVRYGCHGASAHWSPRKQPHGLGFWTHG